MEKEYEQLISEDGLLGNELVYLKLQSIGGAKNNSPNFISLPTKEGEAAVKYQGDETDDDEEIYASQMVIINSEEDDDDNVFG